MEISFRKILLFMLIKYIMFYVFMMFKNNNYALIQIDQLENLNDVCWYLWMFLSLPVICFILFAGPIYHSFSKRNLNTFILIIVGVLIAEYFIYTYLASTSNWFNGLFNAVISVICFSLVFRKEIGELFAEKRDGESKGYL
jgi:hypothetical protein